MIFPTLFGCRHIYSKHRTARHKITLMRPGGGGGGGGGSGGGGGYHNSSG